MHLRKSLSQYHPIFYFLGVWFYRTKRWLNWCFGNKKFSHKLSSDSLPYKVKAHSSVLLRKLGDSEMWMQENKVKNLAIATKSISGILIYPNEVFSFCRLVGLPTRAKGYVEGMEISRGEVRAGIGGGICQIANMIYWLALHSDLNVIERSHHGYDPFPDSNRVLPFGSGAAVFYNYIDLQIENRTDSLFQINLWLTDKHLKGELRADKQQEYTYSVYEKNHHFRKESETFFRNNEIWRTKMVRNGGKVLAEEFITKNNARVKYVPEQ
jgi:vancomycin resistance protein VanW